MYYLCAQNEGMIAYDLNEVLSKSRLDLTSVLNSTSTSCNQKEDNMKLDSAKNTITTKASTIFDKL